MSTQSTPVLRESISIAIRQHAYDNAHSILELYKDLIAARPVEDATPTTIAMVASKVLHSLSKSPPGQDIAEAIEWLQDYEKHRAVTTPTPMSYDAKLCAGVLALYRSVNYPDEFFEVYTREKELGVLVVANNKGDANPTEVISCTRCPRCDRKPGDMWLLYVMHCYGMTVFVCDHCAIAELRGEICALPIAPANVCVACQSRHEDGVIFCARCLAMPYIRAQMEKRFPSSPLAEEDMPFSKEDADTARSIFGDMLTVGDHGPADLYLAPSTSADDVSCFLASPANSPRDPPPAIVQAGSQNVPDPRVPPALPLAPPSAPPSPEPTLSSNSAIPAPSAELPLSGNSVIPAPPAEPTLSDNSAIPAPPAEPPLSGNSVIPAPPAEPTLSDNSAIPAPPAEPPLSANPASAICASLSAGDFPGATPPSKRLHPRNDDDDTSTPVHSDKKQSICGAVPRWLKCALPSVDYVHSLLAARIEASAQPALFPLMAAVMLLLHKLEDATPQSDGAIPAWLLPHKTAFTAVTRLLLGEMEESQDQQLYAAVTLFGMIEGKIK